MAGVTLRAPAKLNLFLHVLGKRADGYHDLESLVTFAPEVADELTFALADDISLRLHGEFATDAGGGENNLVLKAARALQKRCGCTKGARITLAKNIPVGAGLGGGSSDAAAALNGLSRLWQLALGAHELQQIALTLGADVAMCLDPKAAIVRGIGERIIPLAHPLLPMTAVLVHPRVPLLTKEVYGALRDYPLAESWKDDAADFWTKIARARNHLQPSAIAVNAQVAEVLLALETAQPAPRLVRMTGSGACCFALYEMREDADRAVKALANDYPWWWTKVSELNAR